MSKLLFEETFDNYRVDMYNRNAYLAAKDFVEKKMAEWGMPGAMVGIPKPGQDRSMEVIREVE